MNQYRMNLTEAEKSGEEFLKEFKSIVKKKLKNPINLKKIDRFIYW